jgi:D-inositol-3-phosphate glycosyltransferase
VIPNGIDLDRFTHPVRTDEVPVREMLGIGANTLLAGYFGRVDPVKGLNDLFAAWPQVVEAVSPRPAHLLLAGGTGSLQRSISYLPEFLRRSAGPGTTWLDHVDDVAPYMRACDVVVVPSHYEPFGRVAVEAMAAGAMVVATRVGGLAEVMAAVGLDRYLVEPNSPSLLASGITLAATRPLPRGDMASLASNYSLETTVEQVALEFKALVGT